MNDKRLSPFLIIIICLALIIFDILISSDSFISQNYELFFGLIIVLVVLGIIKFIAGKVKNRNREVYSNDYSKMRKVVESPSTFDSKMDIVTPHCPYCGCVVRKNIHRCPSCSETF